MSMGSRSGGAEVIQVVPGTGRLWDDDTPTCGNTCRWETRRGYGAYRVACFVLPVLFFLTTAHMCSIVAAMSAHQKRREAPAFMPGRDRRWARWAQCPRAQQDPRSTRALNGRGNCREGSPGIHAGEDVPNAIDQVLIEGPPLATCHGKRLVAVAVLMTRCELGKGPRAQTGVAVKIALGFCAGLAIAQTGALLGVAKENCDLKTCLVIAVEPLGLQVDVGAEEHGISVALGMDHHHDLESTLQLPMVEHLMVQHDVLVFGIEALK